jgi:NAD+ synthase
MGEESAMKGLSNKIAAWIAERVKESGLRGAVVGLSGGVDSAVVAGLCRKALFDGVLGVIMPCHSLREDQDDAKLVARALGVATTTVSIDGAYDALVSVLPKGPQLSASNVKPRLRMAALYYVASTMSYLVAGTGNRTERLLGYFTKHGDGGADILPVGDLYKREVRELAAELGVPAKVIEKPPSAGLWAGQTDEGEIGLSYDEMDSALLALQTGRGVEKAPQAVMERIKRMMASSEHKRRLADIFEVRR